MKEHHKRQRRLVLQQRRDLSEFRLTVLTLTSHGWGSNNYHRGKAQKITHDLAQWEDHLTTTGQPYDLITQTVDRFPTFQQTCQTFGNAYTQRIPGTLIESHK